MRRTYDADAHDDPSYLRECIIHAFRASLSAMDNNSIEVAVVPGLSTGIYAPNKSEGAKLGGEMLSLLQRAIDGLQLSHLQRVIYCGPSGSGNNTYDTGSSKGGGSTGCRVPGCKVAHQKHYCRVCKDPDSNHFASNCLKAGGHGGGYSSKKATGCRVPGCKEAHQKHYCRVCKDPDSNHFASNCPKA
jgi:hypothetical protein